MTQRMLCRGDEPTPDLYRHIRGHSASINSIAFNPINNTVISGGSDKFVLLWDYVDVSKRALRFEGHTGPINDVTFNSTGELMLSVSDDMSIGIWVPLATGESRFFRGHSAPVRSVAFNPNNYGSFVTGSDDKTVKLWSMNWSKNDRKTKLKTHQFVSSWNHHTNWVRSVRFNMDGSSIITASDDGTINILDVRINEKAMSLPVGKGTPLHAEFNPTASNYFGLATDQEFHIYDMRNGKLVQCYTGLHSKDITKFNFHPCGDFAVTVSEDKSVKILDLIEGRPIFTMHGHQGPINFCCFSQNGSLVATGGKDKSLLIWKPTVIPYSESELKAAGNFELDQPGINERGDTRTQETTDTTDSAQ